MCEEPRTAAVCRLLLVEDEPGLQEAMALFLEVEGFQVLRASDGREALANLAKTRVDLIVTDYMMPRMNGAELTERIRHNPEFSHLPILLMSAALPQHVDKSMADVFMQKPVSMARLLDAIAALLRAPT